MFKNKLHEFYGMLAYHYSKGEGLDKAEEYLIKAGAEALKSSASIEALHYYQDALTLYLNKYGDKASPEKVAMLEKNIAIALFNKGRYIEAVDFFNRVLAFYGEKESSFLPVTMIKFSYSFLVFVFSLYFPSLRFRKNPTQNLHEILDLFHKKCTCLAIPDPVRFFVDSVYSLRIFSNYDLTKCANGINLFSGGSVIFSWPGISFRISRKVLDYCRYKVKQEDKKSVLAYDFPELIWNFLSGNWHDAKPYNPDLVDANLKYGDIMFSSTYLSFHTRLAIEKGDIGQAGSLIQKITEIGDTYEHEYAKTYKYILNSLLLLKTGQFYQACKEAEDGIRFVERLKWGVLSFVLYTFKAKAQILQNKTRAARDTMATLEDIHPEVKLVPLYLSNYLLCKLLYKLNGASLVRPVNDTFKTRLKIGQKALKTVRYVASEQTEAYRLIGTSYWTAGKQKKAVIFWGKSIKTGTQLGAVPELSRTYNEIGNRLLENKSRYSSLSGLSAAEHLEHSAKLFTEIMRH